MWSNDNTVMYRGPAADFDSWAPLLNKIQDSREVNPQWLLAVQKASGKRAKMAWETQHYINKVASATLAARQATNAWLRQNQWPYRPAPPDRADQDEGDAPEE
jgi:hypothetical protein